jgi:hypothetical protein
MGYMNHLHWLFRGTWCQYGFPAERFFLDQCAAHPQDTRYLRLWKLCFSPQTAPAFSNHLTRK